MDLSKIIEIQKEFDRRHGWSLKSDTTSEKLEVISKDIIGILGELGEFSNLIKKLNLSKDIYDEKELSILFNTCSVDLKEELTDTFIYLIRIATHLDLDISDAYLRKKQLNEERFKKYEDK